MIGDHRRLRHQLFCQLRQQLEVFANLPRERDEQIVASRFQGSKPTARDSSVNGPQVLDNTYPLPCAKIAKLVFALERPDPHSGHVFTRNMLMAMPIPYSGLIEYYRQQHAEAHVKEARRPN